MLQSQLLLPGDNKPTPLVMSMTGGPSKIVSLAVDPSKSEKPETQKKPKTAKAKAFEKEVFLALDKIVSTIDSSYAKNMKHVNKQAYKALKKQGINKIEEQARGKVVSLAQEYHPGQSLSRGSQKLLALASEFRNSPSAQSVLLKLANTL